MRMMLDPEVDLIRTPVPGFPGITVTVDVLEDDGGSHIKLRRTFFDRGGCLAGQEITTEPRTAVARAFEDWNRWWIPRWIPDCIGLD